MRSYQPSIATGVPPTFSDAMFDARQPTLQLIYDTAPIGLAFLSPDCRYLRRAIAAAKASRPGQPLFAKPIHSSFAISACTSTSGLSFRAWI
jgi:hypothetical protein